MGSIQVGLAAPLFTLVKTDSNSPLNLFGDFVHWIPTLIEGSDAVYIIAQSLLQSVLTYSDRSDVNQKRGRESYGKALRHVRSVLQRGDCIQPSSDILLAIRTMYVIEVSAALCARVDE
jgi:hypothetical protein